MQTQVMVDNVGLGPLNLASAISEKALAAGVLPATLAGNLAIEGVDEFMIRRLQESTERVMGAYVEALSSFGTGDFVTWPVQLNKGRAARVSMCAREYGKTVPEMLGLGVAYALRHMQKSPERQHVVPALRLMAEHHSTGLWIPRLAENGETDAGVGEVSPEDFSLSEELKARLRAWCQSYERDIDHTSDDPKQYRGFSAEGLAIAKAIKAELPNTQVTYCDELRFALGAPRDERMYEVTLD